MLATLLLLGLILTATATDLLRRKIYNWTTYSGILAALALNGLGELVSAVADVGPEQLRPWGWIGLEESFFGLLACGLLMLVCFVMFRVAGGDVKLIAMIGAFLGLEKGIETLLWTFVLGGCMGLIVLIWRVGPWRLAAGLFRQLAYLVRGRHWRPLSEEAREHLQLPLFLAPNALAAVLIVRFSLLEKIPLIL